MESKVCFDLTDLCAAGHRILSYISVNSHIIIVTVMVIVLGVDSP